MSFVFVFVFVFVSVLIWPDASGAWIVQINQDFLQLSWEIRSQWITTLEWTQSLQSIFITLRYSLIDINIYFHFTISELEMTLSIIIKMLNIYFLPQMVLSLVKTLADVFTKCPLQASNLFYFPSRNRTDTSLQSLVIWCSLVNINEQNGRRINLEVIG